MRQVVAALVDTAVAAGACAAGFCVAYAIVPCTDKGECVLLTPFVLAGVLLGEALYFGLAQVLVGTTFGRWIAGETRGR